MKRFLLRASLATLKISFLFFGTALILSILVAGAGFLYLEPKLPAIDTLHDIRLQVPLRVVSRDHRLIAEFGEFRRIPVTYEEIPEQLAQAFLAAEDDRFFKHPGVDYQGILRAGVHLIRTGSKGQGGSTITMQVARNFFLSSEKTYLRKANEILLSFKIENELSKEEILTLYLNRIFLGQRAYGIGAAAQVYYGKTLSELELHEIAMIAGLPKAPSTMNPIANPQRAKIRRDYVLNRMLDLGFISAEEHLEAKAMPAETQLHALEVEVDAPHFAEMIRREAHAVIGDELYTHGYVIRTSLDSKLQPIAQRVFKSGITDYDQRHGYRGAEQRHSLSENALESELDELLSLSKVRQEMRSGIVTSVDAQKQIAEVYIGKGETIQLTLESVKWARKHISANALGPRISSISDVLSRGDQIRVTYSENQETWSLAQIPRVDGALIAQDPRNGEILALVGGVDFNDSKFNRATQAQRQPGSSFKPFIYALAIEEGFTAASVINDAPVVFEDSGLESSWRPENYSGRFYGPTRLREALAHSRNLVSIRLLQAMSMRKTLSGLERLGFDRSRLPADLSLSLGSNNLTPLELNTAYSIFANGGHRVPATIMLELIDAPASQTLWHAAPTELEEACVEPPRSAWDHFSSTVFPTTKESTNHDDAESDEEAPFTSICAPRALSPQVTYIMNSLLQDVIRTGTGRRALSLGRTDLGGKTGTTNEVKDGWFVGYTPHLVTTAWIGFDEAVSLGNGETGGRSALPIWIDFMREALAAVEQIPFERPTGIVSIRVNRNTGESTTQQDPAGMFELFIDGHLPPSPSSPFSPSTHGNSGSSSGGEEHSEESIF